MAFIGVVSRLALLFWWTFGWWSIVVGLYSLATVVVAVMWTVLVRGPILDPEMQVRLALLLPVGGLLLVTHLRSPQPRYATPFGEKMAELTARGEQFCVILRSFGHDGKSKLRSTGARARLRWVLSGFFPSTRKSVEQVVATVVRRCAGMATYALTDHQQVLAVPGPNWLYAPGASWRSGTEYLIGAAHVIVITLHPDQQYREGFCWEIQEITRQRRHSRVVLALFPSLVGTAAYSRTCWQAAEILAALEGPDGDPRDVPEDAVARWAQYLRANNAMLVDVRGERAGPDDHGIVPVVRSVKWKSLSRTISARVYEDALRTALEHRTPTVVEPR
jgi:hypothetical protein